MPTLRQSIQRHRDAIMQRWSHEAYQTASARGLSAPELLNVFPLVLGALAGGKREEDEFRTHLENHLSDRIRHGFDISEIVEELVILERSFDAVWAELPPAEQPEPAQRHALASAVQDAIVLVTHLFYEHMELDEQRDKRYLRLIQRIADDALRDPQAPLTSRLEEVLELFLEALDVQAASLLLYEPGTKRLLTAASAGLANDELERLATSLDPSTLGGKIASSAEPSRFPDIETTSLDVSDALRHSGLHSLLGVRLPPHRKLFGVLYIGVRHQRIFSGREARRLETLAQRLMLLLDNAQLYEDLREQIASLSRERELRERFVSALAHDLRGPLSTAKMASRLLARDPGRLDERPDLAARIDRNLDRIDRMIRDLLDVARIRAGEQLSLHRDACDLRSLATDVVEELNATYGDRFVLVAPDSVPGFWSEDELRRALWNLATNAVKYGATHAPITVRVDTTTQGGRLSVHNFGPSISSEDQGRLFELHSRLPRMGGAEGWGLGLTLVRAVAEAHGGRVDVHSDPDVGTTFAIVLPFDSRPSEGDVVESAGGGAPRRSATPTTISWPSGRP